MNLVKNWLQNIFIATNYRYSGQGHCASLEGYMHSRGFRGRCTPNPKGCETDAVFVRGGKAVMNAFDKTL